MAFQRISIIAPTYNELDNVIPFIESVRNALDQFDWEILFVDDSSSDGTARKIFECARHNSRVRLILRVDDRGLARSSIQGMLSAKGDLLCVMDVDGQHDPAVVPRMVAQLDEGRLDIVSAARNLGNAGQSTGLSPLRNALSRMGNRLSALVLGHKLADPLTGFFLIQRSAFLDVAPRLGDPGFKLLLDILHSQKKLRHTEIFFDFGSRLNGQSKLDAYVIWRFVTFLLSKMTGGFLSPHLISFLFVGGSGVLVHLAVLYGALALSSSFLTAQIVATLLAASSNFLLNNLLTFRDRRLRGWQQLWGYAKFLAVSSVGIVANISAATTTYDRLVHDVFLATLAGIAIDAVWKFVVASRFIWR